MDNAVRRRELAPISFWQEGLERDVRIIATMLDTLVAQLRLTLPHIPPSDHAEIERVIAELRLQMAHRLASGEDETEGASQGDSEAA